MLLNVLQYSGPYGKERSGPALGWCWGSETYPRAFFLDLALIPSASHPACGQISGFYLAVPPASSSLPAAMQLVLQRPPQDGCRYLPAATLSSASTHCQASLRLSHTLASALTAH